MLALGLTPALTLVAGGGPAAAAEDAGAATRANTPAGMKLVWADEFDKEGAPDPAKWGSERGFVRNEEAQWYQPENAIVRDGKLVIEARREHKSNPEYKAGSADWRTKREFIEYTSASLISKEKASFKYGRFEMRARIDTRPGLWPAFWTLGENGEWPGNGEIDIMEYYRGKLLANIAWGTNRRWNAHWNSVARPLSEFNDADWSAKFHTWRMDWDENSIKLSVDGQILNTQDVNKTINGDAAAKNPFRAPHFIILNLAVGGQNGGDPAQTAFPARFEVDYVRVYQAQ